MKGSFKKFKQFSDKCQAYLRCQLQYKDLVINFKDDHAKNDAEKSEIVKYCSHLLYCHTVSLEKTCGMSSRLFPIMWKYAAISIRDIQIKYGGN